MMNAPTLILRLLLLSGLTSASVQAATQEGVTYDPQTGNYLIAYKAADIDGNEFLDEVIFVPATKIAPVVKARFTRRTDGDFILYQYRLMNRPSASQSIASFGMLAVSDIKTGSQSTPSGWVGSSNVNRTGSGFFVDWSYRSGGNPLAGLTPGSTENNFGFVSNDLPGVGMTRLYGATPLTIWAGEIDPTSDVGKQVNQLETNNFVSVASAAPLVFVPTPYDAAVVLTNIQKHLDTDLVSLKLVDPALVAQMDPRFATAIDAAKRNNAVALRNAIQELRRLLKQECADVDQEGNETETDDKPVAPARIAKLAARVLNFDLKYVGSRN
jgi:hypothetical protein